MNKKEIKVGDELKNNDGESVTILCTDLSGNYPVLGTVLTEGGFKKKETYTKSGALYLHNSSLDRDLILENEVDFSKGSIVRLVDNQSGAFKVFITKEKKDYFEGVVIANRQEKGGYYKIGHFSKTWIKGEWNWKNVKI